MKQVVTLEKNWTLYQLTPAEALTEAQLEALGNGEGDAIPALRMPAQVHDILLDNQRIDEEVRVGWCKSVVWVGKRDWVYRCAFPCDVSPGRRSFLHFGGLDTLADVYLNGECIAAHDDFYLPLQVDITPWARTENVLLLHFHNTYDYLERLERPDDIDSRVEWYRLMRKPQHDFPIKMTHTDYSDEGSSYQGANPYHTPVGVYRDVRLETVDRARFVADDLRTTLNAALEDGRVLLDLTAEGAIENGRVELFLAASGGDIIDGSLPVADDGTGRWRACLELSVAKPALWWPRGFGGQNLYTLTAQLWDGDFLCDTLVRTVGFKHVKTTGKLDFVINGKLVRLWGGSMDPLDGLTHIWQPAKTKRLLDMVETANMNLLRLWGEGIPYDDRFYDECDRRGILIWQEFFLGYGFYPDNAAYRQRYRLEAECLLKRLRHRACLLMWCGGNETHMSVEFEGVPVGGPFPAQSVIAGDFPALVERLDPGRYYHESSPSGGRWANDPLSGDYHTYDCIWQYPGSDYPHFISEHIRTAPPVMHSLKRFVRQENFWPEGYTGKLTYRDRYPLPDSWMERVCISASMHLKTGPIWEYFDADTPEEMVYRFGAAYGQVMRRGLERVRMGSRDGGLERADRSMGHLSCKLNDTWPKIYCAVIDYFQEGYIPFYATKRAQEPVLVCFDILTETINLWLVNDSAEDIRGTVIFGLYSLPEERFVAERRYDAFMPQGRSDIVTNLDFLYSFRKHHLLYARFEDEAGKVVNTSVAYVDIERHLRFPSAKLAVAVEGNTLVITTDRFARCVEITGDANGDAFGWRFEDNYFDLVPGDTKRVKILGGHRQGTITLKPHYSAHTATVNYTY